MNNVIREMLTRFSINELTEKKYALKEVLQEVILCGLSRAGFFQRTAFYGGTALRIFHGLDRFSEDLDFSLQTADGSFSLSDFFSVLRKEVASFGLNLEITEKVKIRESAIQSAFLKGNTKEHMLMFFNADQSVESIPGNEKIKIKFEVDTNPPASASFERRYRLLPVPYEVMLYDMPSLFAGKVHAVICRAWKSRIKGRDLYDYVFFLSKGAHLNTDHLKARLVQSGIWDSEDSFSIADAKRLLCDRFEAIDYSQAKADVIPFLKDSASLEIWSADFFRQITEGLQ